MTLSGVLYVINNINIPKMINVINDIILWDFNKNQCVTNKLNFMEKEEFHVFRDLGELIDGFINFQTKSQDNNTCKTAQQIIDYFKEEQSSFMDLERINCLSLTSIKEWVKSKLPVDGATEMCAVKTKEQNGYIVCLFFANSENVLLDNSPKKRIYCSSLSDDLSTVFNNNDLFIINKL